MSVPGYQEFMFPILKLLSDNKIHYKKDIFLEMDIFFNLTQEQIESIQGYADEIKTLKDFKKTGV